MPTHAELAVTLLNDAATFFRNMANSNAAIRRQMMENAVVFEQMAKTLTEQPDGAAGTVRYAALAGDLLKNAASFFHSVAEENEPIKEQMHRSADIYEQLAKLVAENPLGVMD
jgi:hypothetical protein